MEKKNPPEELLEGYQPKPPRRDDAVFAEIRITFAKHGGRYDGPVQLGHFT